MKEFLGNRMATVLAGILNAGLALWPIDSLLNTYSQGESCFPHLST